MPRRRSHVFTYEELVSVLGPGHSERLSFDPPVGTPAAERRRRHDGWRWNCGCAAFARPGVADAYLWVACSAHANAHRRD